MELPSRSSLAASEGWRRERDSNPRYPFGYSGFQDHRHRPLGHPSAAEFPPDILAGSPFHRRTRCLARVWLVSWLPSESKLALMSVTAANGSTFDGRQIEPTE